MGVTEEVKKFLELLRYMGEKNIGKRGKPPHIDTFGDLYLEDMFTKAADLIESLSATCDQLTDALKTRGFENIEAVFAELDQVKRERDAAVQDLEMCCPCEACTRSCKYDKVNAYDECADFEWRGVRGG